MRKTLVFVNYEHPSHIKDRTHRHIVSTHTGKYSQQLLRSSQSATARQRHVQNSGPATTYSSTYSQPPVLDQDVQPAQTPSDDAVQASQRSPSRHGLIVREKRRCVFNWHNRHHNQRSASHNAEWEPYHTATSPKSYKQPVIGKNESSIRKRVSSSLRDIPRSQSPLSLLGQGRIDPFARFAVDEDYSYLHEVLDHAVQHFWPMIAPSQDAQSQPTFRHFLEDMSLSPMAYYGYQLSLMANIDWVHDNHPKKQLYMQIRVSNIYRTVRLVREHLEKLDGPPSDLLILVVLILATVPAGEILSRSSLPISRFRSPLADAQILDPYGHISNPLPHWTAFYHLVQLKGGLGEMGDRDSAALCQLGDLVISSRQSTPPGLPYHSFFADISELDLEINGQLASSLLKIDLPIFVHSGLHTAIRAGAIATTTLGEYYEDRSASTFLRLLELRNRAQWLSLSVQKSASTQSSTYGVPEAEWGLFEIVRLALLTYNNLVIYPLSPTNEVGIRLGLDLRIALERSIEKQPNLWIEYPRLFLWALILGGISDAAEMERRWYKSHFRRLASSSRAFLQLWPEVEQSLGSFLWQSNVLNEEAVKFWTECTQIDFEDGTWPVR